MKGFVAEMVCPSQSKERLDAITPMVLFLLLYTGMQYEMTVVPVLPVVSGSR